MIVTSYKIFQIFYGKFSLYFLSISSISTKHSCIFIEKYSNPTKKFIWKCTFLILDLLISNVKEAMYQVRILNKVTQLKMSVTRIYLEKFDEFMNRC